MTTPDRIVYNYICNVCGKNVEGIWLGLSVNDSKEDGFCCEECEVELRKEPEPEMDLYYEEPTPGNFEYDPEFGWVLK